MNYRTKHDVEKHQLTKFEEFIEKHKPYSTQDGLVEWQMAIAILLFNQNKGAGKSYLIRKLYDFEQGSIHE